MAYPKNFQLIKAWSLDRVLAFIEFELINLASLVSFGGNLNVSQVQFIAKELLNKWPNESIADFKLCFRYGARGDYDRDKDTKTWRLDGIVINGWMKMYVDDKYAVFEEQVHNWDQHTEVEDPKTNPEVLSEEARNRWFERWKEEIAKIEEPKKITPLTQKEIIEEGGKHPKIAHYPSTTLEDAKERELHFQYIRENYDQYGNKRGGWMNEKEWRELQDRKKQCSSACDWPNCTKENCIIKQIKNESGATNEPL